MKKNDIWCRSFVGMRKCACVFCLEKACESGLYKGKKEK